MNYLVRSVAAGAALFAAISGTVPAEQARHGSGPAGKEIQQLPVDSQGLPFHVAQAKPAKPAPQAWVDPTPPDFGTTKGTARIAGTAGFIDIVGIKLGMKEKDAGPALKNHNSELTLAPLRLLTYTALPQVSMTPVIVADMKPKSNQQYERFSIELTYSPNDAYVWSVSREFNFAPKEAPTAENMEASFRKKYGPENHRPADRQLVWIFDTQGRLVPEQQAKTVYSQCAGSLWNSALMISAGGNRPNPNNQLSNSFYDQQLRGGYYFGNYGRDHSKGLCHSHSIVHMGMWEISAAGQARNLVGRFFVRVSNRQLEASGVQAAHKLLAGAADEIEKKRAGEATKRTGPKL